MAQTDRRNHRYRPTDVPGLLWSYQIGSAVLIFMNETPKSVADSHPRRRISPTCEVLIKKGVQCDLPATHAYPAMGGGWMALCYKHSLKHEKYCLPVDDLIRGGQEFGY